MFERNLIITHAEALKKLKDLMENDKRPRRTYNADGTKPTEKSERQSLPSEG